MLMSNNNQQTVIIRLSTVVMLSAILLTFAVFTNPGPYYNNFTKHNGTQQYSYGEPAAYGGGDKGHNKPVQNVLVAINIDLSDIDNITDAVHAYKFTASAGSVTSHPKSLNVNITSVAAGDDDIVFNVKGTAAVAAGDSFTATGISSSSDYKTVSVTDTLTEKKLGNSGKVLLTGEVDLPLEHSDAPTTAEALS